MPNKEHYKLIKQGVKVWNKWREENPLIKPDLNKAILNKETLREINLENADLSEAQLISVDFIKANFSCANLHKAHLNMGTFSFSNFSKANLSNSFLNMARFNNAKFFGANLSKAILTYADFTDADLEMANFHSTFLADTNLINVDLSKIQNIELIDFHGYSNIDSRTLIKSGKLSKSFLKNIGIPDQLINNFISLSNKSIQYHSCFISYSSMDEEFARKIHLDLQKNGIRCWFAPEDLKIGDKIRKSIDTNIQTYDKLLLILSEHSIKSQWVEQEVENALEKERDQDKIVLLPIRLDDKIMDIESGWAKYIKITRNIGNFINWKDDNYYDKSLERLLKDFKALSET
jgi:uncharacterized protein YjbI with pentapeptide repeats